MTTGIYAIMNLVNNKVYVGSTTRSFKTRWDVHQSYLRSNNHHNRHLQYAWNKYGEYSFQFTVLEEIKNDTIIIEREQYWLDKFRTNGGVYNFCDCAGQGNAGKPRSASTRKKISMTLTGKSRSAEHNRHLGEALKGRKLSAEHCAKLSKSFPSFLSPDGIIYPAGINLRAFCREHGLARTSMKKIILGKRKNPHRGWRLA